MKSTLLHGVNLVCTVAKYQSLTSAAKALNLTVGAVSQQLQQIEHRLGFSAFERHARGIRLTEQGRKLVEATEPHLAAIEDNVFQLTNVSEQKQIRLKLTPSFAFKWLVPRLEKFHHQYPDIQVHTFAEGALVDSENRDFDIAIDYGPIPYPHKHAELLLEESLVPVMSPDYLERYQSADRFQWSSVTFLHDAMPWQNAHKDHEWRFWADSNGLDVETNRGHFFNRTDMAMSAAEAGVGVALARLALLTNELDKGTLVAPYDAILANAGYFLLTHSETPYTRLFKKWLQEQIDNE